jgi:ribonuclease D
VSDEPDRPEASAEDAPPLLPPPAEDAVALIESAADLEAFCRIVAAADSVALDTEANSMHAYRERTCIVQITASGHSAIVDALAVTDLAALRAALDRDDVEVVFHGGDYDITVLTRDHDFRFGRVFDTMIAATLLDEPKVGLADLVAAHFGHKLDKRFQRADWARRPLDDEQLDYLRRDTLYLPALREHLGQRLAEAGLAEEAAIEFARLARRKGKPATVDPEGWRRIKGAAHLDARGRAVLHALFQWREEESARRDRPPFKVLSPRAMLQIAQRPPPRARHPGDLPHLGHHERRRHGKAILAALRAGLEAAEQGRVPARSNKPVLTAEEKRTARTAKQRTDRLKAWRRDEAKRRKVPNVVVLPNPAIAWLVREAPDEVTALRDCPDIGEKRMRRYGTQLLDALHGRRPRRDKA